MYGWHPSRAAVAVRLTDVPYDVPIDLLVAHMSDYGQVLTAQRARERAPGRIGARGLVTGVVHLSMALNSNAPLPSFIEVETPGGGLTNTFTVFSDLHRRRCYRCGDTGHVSQFCRARERMRTAPPHTWSVLRVPPGVGPAGGGSTAAAADEHACRRQPQRSAATVLFSLTETVQICATGSPWG